jgi:hypothetical protein
MRIFNKFGRPVVLLILFIIFYAAFNQSAFIKSAEDFISYKCYAKGEGSVISRTQVLLNGIYLKALRKAGKTSAKTDISTQPDNSKTAAIRPTAPKTAVKTETPQKPVLLKPPALEKTAVDSDSATTQPVSREEIKVQPPESTKTTPDSISTLSPENKAVPALDEVYDTD